ncbi:PepSY domain-containing protein [Sandaracinus amylolyticus]|uniref:PepSY domain-containing protein n=1 Tax=Sandaracinus amylolyticus TaxID=927083 RepID=UPI001F1900DD|nr:PepSY domain-containing protein [Sandaracinus amylolyticus]UJR79930.1 PepSY domain-containing protein [Sandaracinus amylolyticus]
MNRIKTAAVMLSMVVAFGAGGSIAAAQQAAPRVAMEDARRIALEHVPGGNVESIEQDHEDGRVVYEVEVRDAQGREHELVIDADDGRVIRTEVEDEHDDD